MIFCCYFFQSAPREGRTVLLSTHYMDEADTLGDRVVGGGKKTFLKTPFWQCLFCLLINTTLKLIIMGLSGKWKEHESFEERNMNIVE